MGNVGCYDAAHSSLEEKLTLRDAEGLTGLSDVLLHLTGGQLQQGLNLHVRQSRLERFVASGLRHLVLQLRSSVVLLVGDEARGAAEVERLEIVSGLEAGVGQTLLQQGICLTRRPLQEVQRFHLDIQTLGGVRREGKHKVGLS